MKKSFLKKSSEERVTIIDSSTGEVISDTVNVNTYLANTKEEFYLMYSSMVTGLKRISGAEARLFAAFIGRYGNGSEFSLSIGFKETLSEELALATKTIDIATRKLIEQGFILRLGRNLFRVNPMHVFRGSTTERNRQVKATIELCYNNKKSL